MVCGHDRSAPDARACSSLHWVRGRLGPARDRSRRASWVIRTRRKRYPVPGRGRVGKGLTPGLILYSCTYKATALVCIPRIHRTQSPASPGRSTATTLDPKSPVKSPYGSPRPTYSCTRYTGPQPTRCGLRQLRRHIRPFAVELRHLRPRVRLHRLRTAQLPAAAPAVRPARVRARRQHVLSP